MLGMKQQMKCSVIFSVFVSCSAQTQYTIVSDAIEYMISS